MDIFLSLDEILKKASEILRFYPCSDGDKINTIKIRKENV